MNPLEEILDITLDIDELYYNIGKHNKRRMLLVKSLLPYSIGDDIFILNQRHEGWFRLEDICHVESRMVKKDLIIIIHLGIRAIGKKRTSIGEFIIVRTYLNRDMPLNVYDNALILEVRKNGDRQNG
ncbi:hypothetical protein [Leptospira interrogans]|uniref:hypothetical protein n=1 Tax=Leptospira interrogans TaxID=173 RepID=UPI00036F3EB5|nr:hypothetical protein [Leptospira interrogans]ULG86671.1 hypothetical protein FH594_21740 [Leptospira interrogans]UMQ60549.1 hypothetical protein FH585_21165 [Leptospira interrogans]